MQQEKELSEFSFATTLKADEEKKIRSMLMKVIENVDNFNKQMEDNKICKSVSMDDQSVESSMNLESKFQSKDSNIQNTISELLSGVSELKLNEENSLSLKKIYSIFQNLESKIKKEGPPPKSIKTVSDISELSEYNKNQKSNQIEKIKQVEANIKNQQKKNSKNKEEKKYKKNQNLKIEYFVSNEKKIETKFEKGVIDDISQFQSESIIDNILTPRGVNEMVKENYLNIEDNEIKKPQSVNIHDEKDEENNFIEIFRTNHPKPNKESIKNSNKFLRQINDQSFEKNKLFPNIEIKDEKMGSEYSEKEIRREVFLEEWEKIKNEVISEIVSKIESITEFSVSQKLKEEIFYEDWNRVKNKVLSEFEQMTVEVLSNGTKEEVFNEKWNKIKNKVLSEFEQLSCKPLSNHTNEEVFNEEWNRIKNKVLSQVEENSRILSNGSIEEVFNEEWDRVKAKVLSELEENPKVLSNDSNNNFQSNIESNISEKTHLEAFLENWENVKNSVLEKFEQNKQIISKTHKNYNSEPENHLHSSHNQNNYKSLNPLTNKSIFHEDEEKIIKEVFLEQWKILKEIVINKYLETSKKESQIIFNQKEESVKSDESYNLRKEIFLEKWEQIKDEVISEFLSITPKDIQSIKSNNDKDINVDIDKDKDTLEERKEVFDNEWDRIKNSLLSNFSSYKSLKSNCDEDIDTLEERKEVFDKEWNRIKNSLLSNFSSQEDKKISEDKLKEIRIEALSECSSNARENIFEEEWERVKKEVLSLYCSKNPETPRNFESENLKIDKKEDDNQRDPNINLVRGDNQGNNNYN